MIASGICTDSHYETGRDELLNCMTRHHESSSSRNDVYLLENNANHTNEWSDDDNDNDILVSQMATKAKEELRQYNKWKKSRFLPEMKKVKVPGAYDDVGHLRVNPILFIGPVVKEDNNPPSGQNHANYMNKKGYYDVVQVFLDTEHYFPTLSIVVVGQLSPHVTTKVDCEPLFSQVGHQSQYN